MLNGLTRKKVVYTTTPADFRSVFHDPQANIHPPVNKTLKHPYQRNHNTKPYITHLQHPPSSPRNPQYSETQLSSPLQPIRLFPPSPAIPIHRMPNPARRMRPPPHTTPTRGVRATTNQAGGHTPCHIAGGGPTPDRVCPRDGHGGL